MSSLFENLSATDLAMQLTASFAYEFKVIPLCSPFFSQTTCARSLKILLNPLLNPLEFMHYTKNFLHLLFVHYS